MSKIAAEGSKKVKLSQNNLENKDALYFSERNPFLITHATCVEVAKSSPIACKIKIAFVRDFNFLNFIIDCIHFC